MALEICGLVTYLERILRRRKQRKPERGSYMSEHLKSMGIMAWPR